MRPGLFNRRRGLPRAGVLNLVVELTVLHVVVQDIRIQPDAALPGDRGGLRVDAHLLELAHVPPQLERADLEQVAEEDASLEPVLEPEPQVVVLLGLAGCDAHLAPFLHFVCGHRAAPQSQLSAPPVWYSITRVSKKLRSFVRSIISLIQGKGFEAPGKSVSRPICWQRRLAMKRRYSLNIGAFRPSTPRGMVSSA